MIQLSKVEHAIEKGNYGIPEIRLLENTNYDDEEVIASFYQTLALLYQGKYQIALNKLNVGVYKQIRSNVEFHIRLQILKSELLFRTGDYESSLDNLFAIKEIIITRKPKDFELYLGVTHTKMAMVYWRTNKSNIAKDHLNTSINICNKFNFKKGLAENYNLLGLVEKSQGNFSSAFDLFLESLEINKQINFVPGLAANHNNIGLMYRKFGKFANSISYFNRAFDYYSQLNNNYFKAVTLTNVATSQLKDGQFDTVLNTYLESLQIFKEIGNELHIADINNNIGLIYLNRGYLDQAEKYFENALKIKLSRGIDFQLAMIYHNLGLVFMIKRKETKAEIYLKKSLNLRENQYQDYYYADTLFQLVNISIGVNDIEAAQHYFKKLKIQSNKVDNILIKQIFQLSQAYWWMKVDNKTYEALKTFSKVSQFDKLPLPLKIFAKTNMVTLKLHIQREEPNDLNLNTIICMVEDMYKIAQNEKMYLLILDILILKSKIHTIQLNWEIAKNIIVQASILSKEKKLGQYINLELELNNLKRLKQLDKYTLKLLDLQEETQIQQFITQRGGTWGAFPTFP